MNLNDTYNEAIEEAAKIIESYSLAEKLAKLTMVNPVTHSINVTRAMADSIRQLKKE